MKTICTSHRGSNAAGARRALPLWTAAAVLASLAGCAQWPRGAATCDGAVNSTTLARTELLFGLNRPGGMVSDEQFQRFVDQQVTPAFPQGLTLILARGQFRGANGVIEREASRLLILLHPPGAQADAVIEGIRNSYKSQFEQESVLRFDGRACASF